MAQFAKMFPPDLPPSSVDVEKKSVDDARWVGQGRWECGTERACGPPDELGFGMYRFMPGDLDSGKVKVCSLS